MTDATEECKNINADDIDWDNDSDWIKCHQAHIEQQENDIVLMANFFQSMDAQWKSWEEVDAWEAQGVIYAAKQKIKNLREEIEQQEAIILNSQKIVIKFKRQAQFNKTGRPERSQEKEVIAKKFVAKWIMSLMGLLEVSSSGQLEKMVSGTSERNWRRWLNGDAIPTAKTFEKLLNAKIDLDHGKYAGNDLQKLPTDPKNKDLLTLLHFI